VQRVVVDGDAYALYRVHQSLEDDVSAGFLSVLEVVAATHRAEAAAWRYLLDVDWLAQVKAALLPVDTPLLLLLAEPRRARLRVAEALWLRLVDLRAALPARGYEAAEGIVLDVRDAFCPWNEGRWCVPGGERVDAEPDLRLDVADLASVYLGGFTFAHLRRGLRVEELRPGAVERADDLFRTRRAPWCPEMF
jgi:predicted acetyltransferase